MPPRRLWRAVVERAAAEVVEEVVEVVEKMAAGVAMAMATAMPMAMMEETWRVAVAMPMRPQGQVTSET